MPSSMSEFIQQIQGLVQTKLAQEEAVRRQQAQTANLAGVFTGLARQTTNPQALSALQESFSKLAGLDPRVLAELAGGTAPNLDVMQGSEVQAGLQSMAPGQRNALQQSAAFAALTGGPRFATAQSDFLTSVLGGSPDIPESMTRALQSRLSASLTPGQLARDTAVADLPPDNLSRAARIETGLEPTQAQREQITLQGIGLIDEKSLREAELKFRNDQWAQEVTLRKQQLQAQAAGQTKVDPLAVLESYRKAWETVQANKNNYSDAETQFALNHLNSLYAMMVQAGIAPQTDRALTLEDIAVRALFNERSAGSQIGGAGPVQNIPPTGAGGGRNR